MAGRTYSGGIIRYHPRPLPLRLFTRQRLESLHGPPERVETYALADGGWIEFYFYRMPQPQPGSFWRRLFHRRERKPRAKQLVPWGFQRWPLRRAARTVQTGDRKLERHTCVNRVGAAGSRLLRSRGRGRNAR